jgi:hypothetical protein
LGTEPTPVRQVAPAIHYPAVPPAVHQLPAVHQPVSIHGAGTSQPELQVQDSLARQTQTEEHGQQQQQTQVKAGASRSLAPQPSAGAQPSGGPSAPAGIAAMSGMVGGAATEPRPPVARAVQMPATQRLSNQAVAHEPHEPSGSLPHSAAQQGRQVSRAALPGEGPSTAVDLGLHHAPEAPSPQQAASGSRGGQEASHAPLPQLPDLSNLRAPDEWDARCAQVAALMQLARALRGPADLGPLAGRLQDISNRDLWGLMAQCYQPVQQLQAVGGSEADVRALANRLLDRITAADAAGSGQPHA